MKFSLEDLRKQEVGFSIELTFDTVLNMNSAKQKVGYYNRTYSEMDEKSYKCSVNTKKKKVTIRVEEYKKEEDV